MIVAYDSRHLLPACLDSLADGAAGLRYETIVVDNASQDGTREWLRHAYPGVRLIANSSNRGFARASNQGLAVARGTRLLLLNPDTVVGAGALASTARYLDAHPNMAAASCKLVRPDGRLDGSCKRGFPSLWDAFARFSGLTRLFPNCRWFTRYDALDRDENLAQDVPLIDGCFMMIRRAAFESVGPLDERFYMYAEETDWCRRAWDGGWTIGYDPTGVTLHLKGEITRHHTFRMLYHFHRSMALYCLKYRPWWDPSLFLILPGIAVRYFALVVINALRRERRVSG